MPPFLGETVLGNTIHPSKVLVTGATGAVGPRLVWTLHHAGYNIRTFSLDEPQIGLLPKNVELIIGDVTDPVAVRSAMKGVDAIIHLV